MFWVEAWGSRECANMSAPLSCLEGPKHTPTALACGGATTAIPEGPATVAQSVFLPETLEASKQVDKKSGLPNVASEQRLYFAKLRSRTRHSLQVVLPEAEASWTLILGTMLSGSCSAAEVGTACSIFTPTSHTSWRASQGASLRLATDRTSSSAMSSPPSPKLWIAWRAKRKHFSGFATAASRRRRRC